MILTSIVAVKYCALVLVVSLAGWSAASLLHGYAFGGPMMGRTVMASVIALALLNLLRAGGVL